MIGGAFFPIMAGPFFHFGVGGLLDWRCDFHDWQEVKIIMAAVIFG